MNEIVHWALTPSTSSIISLPIVAKVVHLQFAIALAAHRLWTLHLHTSHDRPCDVTTSRKQMKKYHFIIVFTFCFRFSIKTQFKRILTQISTHIAICGTMIVIYKPVTLQIDWQTTMNGMKEKYIYCAYQWWWFDRKSCVSVNAGS